ncbi:DUF599 domain-containing protein [Limibaculum sp. M0105]|uniref:DUF599 domain-containing protein n=1 Tax=Thermohalobaculum xanthum TaxID=2753746 RepID=A0A8J7M953_9RHOB|nr:DUF599 domain-containing protein [Thermohalobaculum xanthum]MBK0400611.1 DUF599 domain-containing protein [Thermohalobaculum xanthum]
MSAVFLLSTADLAAVCVFLAVALGMRFLIEHAPASHPSTTQLMARYRRAWMHEIPKREHRIVDATLISSLRNGAAFFASGSMLAIGGLFAALGQAERIKSVATDLAEGIDDRTVIWEVKLLFLLVIVVGAFLRFVWAHRLFGYCAVLIGAIPTEGTEAETRLAAARAAALNVSAARSFNRGLRGTYFSLAALSWFIGPVALGVASVLTAAILYRREFMSESRAALMASPED